MKNYLLSLLLFLSFFNTSSAVVVTASFNSTSIDTSAELRAILTDETGTGVLYFQSGALGTPTSGTLTNCTGLPVSGISTSANVQTMLGAANNSGIRSSIGLGTLAVQNSTLVSIGGGIINSVEISNCELSVGCSIDSLVIPLLIADGGTSANTAASARTNLGLAIGTNVQAYDADLTTYAGITPSANVQTLLGSADYAAVRSSLGLVVGTNIQAYDADLTTYAGITPSATVQSLLAASSTSTARTAIGLSSTTLAAQSKTSVDITGGTLDSVEISNSTLGTGCDISGLAMPVPIADGGTGSATASDARTALGLGIGVNVQAYDADLTTYAGITPSSNVQTLLGAANYAAFRSSLLVPLTGDVTASGLTQSTAKLLGRTTASSGGIEEISASTGLTLASGTLVATAGTLKTITTQVGNTSTGETDLASYTIAAGKLANDGDSVWFEASGTLAANVNTKTIKVKFGSGSNLTVFTHAVTQNNVQWTLRGRVIRTGAATQKGYASSIIGGSGLLSNVVTNLNHTLSGTSIIKVTGQSSSLTNDVVLETFVVGFDNAAP